MQRAWRSPPHPYGLRRGHLLLYTANDAYMRDFTLSIPEDCVASETEEQYECALRHMRRQLKADTGPNAKLKLP